MDLLKHVIRLYVPSGEHEDKADELTRLICKEAGGATVYDAEGFWVHPVTDMLESEPVKVIEVYHNGGIKKALKILDLFNDYGRDAEQHSLAASIQGEMWIWTLEKGETHIPYPKGYKPNQVRPREP